jgi:hypothetical protein
MRKPGIQEDTMFREKASHKGLTIMTLSLQQLRSQKTVDSLKSELGGTSILEHLPRKYKALNSNPSTAKLI